MSLRECGPITARCMYCTAWEHDQLPDEHSHEIKIDYDNTCDTVSLYLDGKVMFNIDLQEWKKIHERLDEVL